MVGRNSFGEERAGSLRQGRRRSRLLLLEQFFYPDGWGGAELPRDLAVHLAREGHTVEVICGTEPYAPLQGEPGPDPRADGVVIRRVPPLVAGGDVHRHKLLRQVWFCAWAIPWLLFRRPPDLFISQTNPPPAIPFVALAARCWRRPFLLIAMDLYPEVIGAHGTWSARGIMVRVAAALFNWTYRSASRVVALGPIMAEKIRVKGVDGARVVEISNWATGDAGVVRGGENRLRSGPGHTDGFVLLYSGNLGLSHEFDTLLQGFARARKQVPALRLVFVGKGGRLADAQQLARELGLGTSVTFLPPVAASRLPETMGLADLGIVTLRSGFEGLVVPSKLLGYMARGIPVLYIGPRSDAELVIDRHACGICIRNGDAEAVARAILDAHRDPQRLAAMGHAGQLAYEQDLSRTKALSRYSSVVQACLQACGSEGRPCP